MNNKSMSERLSSARTIEAEEAVEAVAVETSRELAARCRVEIVVVLLALSHNSLKSTSQISSY